MIVLFYVLAVLAFMATLFCGYLALVPMEALRRGAAPAVVEVQFGLAVLVMVICLAAGSILQRLDALRQDAHGVPMAPPRIPRARSQGND